MSKTTKQLYDSARNRENYTFHPGKQFHLEWHEEGACYLFALSDRAATMLRQMCAVFPKFYWVWGIEGPQKDWTVEQWQQWDKIQGFVSEVEAALVAGCDLQQFIDSQKAVADALLVVARAIQDNPTVININNLAGCTTCEPGQSQNGVVTITDDGVTVEGEFPPASVPLIGSGN